MAPLGERGEGVFHGTLNATNVFGDMLRAK